LTSVGRGAAFGDLDNDGDIDVVVANDNGPVELLLNEVGQRNHWIGIRAVRTPASKASDAAVQDALGARIAIRRDDGRLVWRRARADGSYLSANDPRALVGLGQSSKVARVRVVWPDGRLEEWSDVPIDRYTTLKEGTGK
jgi:hypothetical protein